MWWTRVTPQHAAVLLGLLSISLIVILGLPYASPSNSPGVEPSRTPQSGGLGASSNRLSSPVPPTIRPLLPPLSRSGNTAALPSSPSPSVRATLGPAGSPLGTSPESTAIAAAAVSSSPGVAERPTPAPHETPEPAAPGAALPIQPSSPDTRPGASLLVDNFDQPTQGWLPSASNPQTGTILQYVKGEYLVQQVTPRAGRRPAAFLPGVYDDASLAVDARLEGATEHRYVALGCRSQSTSESHYRLVVVPHLSLIHI